MSSEFDGVIALPFGMMGISIQQNQLAGLTFLPPTTKILAAQNELAYLAEAELRLWCSNPKHSFDLPLRQNLGTSFQQRVWQFMLQIPAGETRTYGQAAKTLHSSPRAVGGACGRNPLPIIVPCHRITAQKGLGGFNQQNTGWLIEIKQWLLQHEQQANSGS